MSNAETSIRYPLLFLHPISPIHRHFKSRQEATKKIMEDIEVFYNRQRKQKNLGYLSPVAFEQWFHEQ